MHHLITALERAGATVRGRSVRCPFHDDTNPSGAIYLGNDNVWRYHCFVCAWNQGRNYGHVGDVLKAIGEPSTYVPRLAPKSSTSAVRRLAERVDWEVFMERYGMGTGTVLRRLAEQLDVSIYTLSSFGVQIGAHSDVFLIPMYDGQGKVCGVQRRWLDDRKNNVADSRAGLFHPPAGLNADIVCITEGFTDAAVAWELGYDAVGCLSASTSLNPLATFLSRRRPMRCVIFADGDEAGNGFADRVKKQVGRHSLSTTIIRHSPGQDLRSWRPSRAALEAVIHAGG